MLGIARSNSEASIIPDYSKTVKDIYISVARQYIQSQEFGLTILSCSQPSYSTLDLPSWVPDWSSSWRGQIRTRSLFRAGGRLQPQVIADPKLNTVSIYGRLIGSVTKIGGIQAADREMNPLLPVCITTRFQTLIDRLGLCGEYPCTKEDYKSALLSTVTAGQGHEVLTVEHKTFNWLGGHGEFDINPWNSHNIRWNFLREKLVWAAGELDIFQTEGGYLGLGSANAQVGDAVCILSGGYVPFILRPLENNGYNLSENAMFMGS